MEYKRNREEKHQWRIGDLSGYEGGDIFSATVQEYSLFKSEQMPPDGKSGAFFWYLDSNEGLFADVLAGAGLHLPLNLCHSSPAP